MVINMNESELRTIEQIEQFLAASAEVAFTAHGDDVERYAHISRVLKRFDYTRCSRHDRGVLLRYLQHTSGYSRAQLTRRVARWHSNRLAGIPLVKRYRAPAERPSHASAPPWILSCWWRWIKPTRVSADRPSPTS